MGRVIIGAEDGIEPLTGAGVDDLEELARLPIAVPSLFDTDLAPVGHHEGGDVDRVAMGMFGQFTKACDGPTIIGAERFDPHDLRPQYGARGGLHAIARPGGEIGGQLASHRAQIGRGHAKVDQLDAAQRAAPAAERPIGQGGIGDRLRIEFRQTLAKRHRLRRCRTRGLGDARHTAARHQIAAARAQHHRHRHGQRRAAKHRHRHRPLYQEPPMVAGQILLMVNGGHGSSRF